MRRFIAGLSLALLLTGCDASTEGLTLGAYLFFDAQRFLERPNVRFDESGIPETYYAHLGWQRNPLTVAQWGLSEHARYVRQRLRSQEAAFMSASDWLVETQRDDGAWEYDFPWFNGVTDLPVPWISSIQQGQAISLLARAYEHTKQQTYLDAAQLALRPFLKHVDDGGLVDAYDGIGPTYEEYPAPGGSTFVLNGWMFALIALHELHALTGDELARRLFEESEAALRILLHLYQDEYDGLAWSTYDFRHLLGGTKYLVPPSYMRLQAFELEYLYRATGHQPYGVLLSAWEASARASGVKDLPGDR